ncbi:M15 family metallopeptidase [Sinomonas sp. ASV322]|uniref:M15 family metallopeptidase n=1 Tax=Sinomonas sp. ASV322 TaxID=3041920 RepID=UPI0027DD5AB8|nr:M15 family metallopeptidase [Sinomonas sp. ASV322]MDQ4501890.1 M15 family metallopeptidase [Sinomonas sp. ASV322]
MRDGPHEPTPRIVSRRTVALATLSLGLTACAPAERAPSGTATPTSAGPTPSSSAPGPSLAPSASPSVAPSSTPPAAGPLTSAPATASSLAYSLTDPASQWVVVNKRRPLNPIDYAPPLARPNVPLEVSGESAQVHPTTARAAEALFAAAAGAGASMTLASGYRSYATQVATYNAQVAAHGQAMADVASARPGHSEHQTGWAFDVGAPGGCNFAPCFAGTSAARWIAEHAYEFGFIVRYPFMLHDITGYYYEPWHVRFIGIEASTDMKRRGVATLEEYFGLPAAPTY